MKVEPLLPQTNEVKNLVNQAKRVFESYAKDLISQSIQEFIQNHTNNNTSNTSDNQYLTINEACELLKISKTTLWRWSENGQITKHYLFGNPRYSEKELLELVKSIESKKHQYV